jgi:L-lactate dehydrogenase complex protein LldG
MLARIRAARDVGESVTPLAPAPRDYRRAGFLAPGSDAVTELLTDRLIDYRADVTITEATGLSAAVDSALGTSRRVVVPPGLPAAVRDACGAGGREVTVDGDPVLLTAEQLDGIDAVVTGARVAIADTGTIILDGSPDQGRRAISLVPDLHVVVLDAGVVVQSVPEGLAGIEPTRPLTMIAGPSATSDIELSRVEGVHGPRTLRVIIVR